MLCTDTISSKLNTAGSFYYANIIFSLSIIYKYFMISSIIYYYYYLPKTLIIITHLIIISIQ